VDGGEPDEGPDDEEFAPVAVDTNTVTGEPESLIVAEALVLTEERVAPLEPTVVETTAPTTEPPALLPEPSDLDPNPDNR
jgi:hypothetical protein